MFAASRIRFVWPIAAAFSIALVLPGASRAQSDGPAPLIQQLAVPLGAGDVAVTGFSGATLATPDLPAGVDPVTQTVIDANGVSLRIFDLSTLGGPQLGQVVVPPVKLTVPARDIGQVFGLAFDDGAGPAGTGAPNLYAATTSLFGLQIVGAPGPDGAPTRLKEGAPGARFMDGQVGAIAGGGPGAIWRIDGVTGAVSLVASTTSSGAPNSGPGVGDLAFDRRSRNLYASDLDTGLIHRFDVEQAVGADLGQFDHGMSGRPGAGLPSLVDDGKVADIQSPAFKVEDPQTWGFTAPERRVVALAVRGGRLYYSVAAGPEIWSVELAEDGSFAATARREIAVKADQPFTVTDIVFDGQGRMILAQRGTQKAPFDYGQFVEPAQAATLRYVPAPPGGAELWMPDPEEYAIGLPAGNRMGLGGVALHRGFNPDGSIGPSCEQTLLTTGEDLRDEPALIATIPPGPINVHGFQINDASLVKPANAPPLQGAFAAYDPARADPEVRGHIGDIEAVPCLGVEGEPAPEPGYTPPPVIEGGIDTFDPEEFGPEIDLPGDDRVFLRKEALTDTCTQDGGCAFGITVFNPGPDPIEGPFQIDDIFTAGGAQLPEASIIGAPNEPWECTDGKSTTCIHPGPLPVGETTLTLNFKPGPLNGAKEVRNCVAPSGTLDPDGLPPVIEDKDEKKDEPVKELRKPKIPAIGNAREGFKLEMKPGQACTDKGGCKIEFTVENTSGAPFTGKVNTKTVGVSKTGGQNTDPADKFADKFTVQKADAPPEFACKVNSGEGASSTVSVCEAGAVTLLPGEKKTFSVEVQPEERGIAGRPVDELSMVASVSLSSPAKSVTLVGQAGIVVKTPDEQAAEAKKDPKGKGENGEGDPKGEDDAGPNALDDLPPEQCATIAIADPKGGGGGKVDPEDPKGGGGGKTNEQTVDGVTIGKSAAKGVVSCKDTEDCRFTILVRNTTDKPIPGQIEVTETVSDGDGALFGATELSSGPTAPWTCEKAGQTFTCRHPGPIEAGASADFDIGFKLGKGSAAKAVKNCALLKGAKAPVCATVPTDADVAPPPAQPTKLTIEKKAIATQCSDSGTGCRFDIAITNPGPEEFTQPIKLDEKVTGPNGELFTGTRVVQGVSVPQPGVDVSFSCSKTGTSFECHSFGAVKIPAGKTAHLMVDFVLGENTKANAIKNCVSFAGDPEQKCASIPLVNGPLLRARKASASEGCTPQCTFTIDIRNEGNAPAEGPFRMKEIFTPANGVETIEMISGDFNCLRLNGEPDFTCLATGKALPPGGQLSGTMILRNASPAPEWKNCLELVQTNPSTPVDTSNADRCATVTDKTPPKPNITITKLAPDAVPANGTGKCALNTLCRFKIEIRNTGDAPFTGELVVKDNVTNDAGPLSMVDASPLGWTCTNPAVGIGGNFGVCRRQVTNFPPQTSFFLEAFVSTNKLKKNNTLENCASIDIDAANDSFADDNKDCATVLLDPFNVKVAKSGGQNCKAGGECSFALTLFNPGPIEHNAPVILSDKLDIGTAPIVSSNIPADICATPPTQVPFSCTSPGDIELPLNGEPKVFTVVVKMPEGATRYSNCASVAGAAGAPADGDAGPRLQATGGTDSGGGAARATGNEVCVTADLKPKDPGSGGSNPVQPQADPTPPVTPAPAQCFAGMVADASGRCACPAGTSFNGRACAPSGGGGGVVKPTVPVVACPAGTSGTYPNCKVFTGGSNGVNPGGDPCPRGTTGTQPNCRPIVLPPCPRGTSGVYPNCRVTQPKDPNPSSGGSNGLQPGDDICPRGTTGTPPNCRRIQVTPSCPDGTTGRYPRCRPITVEPETPSCPDGTIGRYPRCRPVCPSGSVYRDGACASTVRPSCPDGTIGRYPRCRPIQSPDPEPQQSQCRGDLVGTPPNCSCPAGTRPLGRSFRCVTIRETPDPVRDCPPGTRGVYPRCFRDRPEPQGPAELRRCFGGQIGTPPNCTCPAGTRYRNDRCRPIDGSGPDNGGPVRPPQVRQCPGDLVGTPPNCRCPGANDEREGNRCFRGPK